MNYLQWLARLMANEGRQIVHEPVKLTRRQRRALRRRRPRPRMVGIYFNGR